MIHRTEMIVVWIVLLRTLTGETKTFTFQDCNSNLSVLEVLPGGGWDNIRNKDMGIVMNMNYSRCRTTEDRQYLIPDEVYVIPQKQTNIDIHSELIEDWQSYKDAFSNDVNAEASYLKVLNGKFSEKLEETKIHNVYDKTSTTRVQVRNVIYSVKARPDFSFDITFKKQLLEIAQCLASNQTQRALYLAEMLVLRYGTHVLTSLDAGASLVQEDQVSESFLLDNAEQKSSVTASAAVSFFSTVNIGIKGSSQTEDEMTKKYRENTTDSKIESHGGVPFYPGITLAKWQEGISNNLVAVSKFGLPLPFFITPERLPEVPETMVKEIANTLDKAINLYYAVNTHPGCLDSKSPNFNFQANVDDGSCHSANTNFTFGGVYQTCSFYLPPYGKIDFANSLCQSYFTKNPLTGDFSCPPRYTPVLLNSVNYHIPERHTDCTKDCAFFIFGCDTNCETTVYYYKIYVSSYWCAALESVPQDSGLLFGGLYSKGAVNPVTQTHACPPYFYPLRLFEDLGVCVSSDYEMGGINAVPFGGFFSCKTGNPLAGHLNTQAPGIQQYFFYRDSPTSYAMKCPLGMSQHQAFLSDGCQVMYCIQAGELFAGRLPPIQLPPFRHAPLFNFTSPEVRTLHSEGNRTWVKGPGSLVWTLVSSKNARGLTKGRSRAPSQEGPTIAISVTVTVILVALIAGVGYSVKWWRSRGFRRAEEGTLVGSHPTYGSTAVFEELEDSDTREQPF
ncbi:macrophage-expressed gene 1 protein-like [Lepisosteus oculatus]|uniref:macrophage-expressed gene 1 protein-like n=1 Tax=Lepisosteus oculatus TaxID=7918 RepID=UPI003712C0B5